MQWSRKKKDVGKPEEKWDHQLGREYSAKRENCIRQSTAELHFTAACAALSLSVSSLQIFFPKNHVCEEVYYADCCILVFVFLHHFL